MSANHKRLLALVLWAEVVFALAYWKWWPHPLELKDFGPNERALILPLPENGILARIIDRGTLVSLAMTEQPKSLAAVVPVNNQVPQAKAAAAAPTNKQRPPQPVAPLIQAVPSASVLEHARVLGKVCKMEIQTTTRVAVCYVVIAVPKDRVAALTSAADKVSVWVEGK